MSTDSDINFINRHLVSTLDKKETLATLRVWRKDCRDHKEADLLGDLIKLVDSGELDG